MGPDNERLCKVWWKLNHAMGYLLNELLILDMKFANLVPLGRHLYERHDWWPPAPHPPPPPFYFWFSKRDLTMIAYAKFMGFLSVGYFSIGTKFQLSLSPCRIPYYAFNNSIYTSQIFRTKIKIIPYLLQSHLTQLDQLYQTPSPKPGCRKLGLYTCQYTWVHLHPSITDTIAQHQLQYCLWRWKTMHPLNLQFLLIVAGLTG